MRRCAVTSTVCVRRQFHTLTNNALAEGPAPGLLARGRAPRRRPRPDASAGTQFCEVEKVARRRPVEACQDCCLLRRAPQGRERLKGRRRACGAALKVHACWSAPWACDSCGYYTFQVEEARCAKQPAWEGRPLLDPPATYLRRYRNKVREKRRSASSEHDFVSQPSALGQAGAS